MFFEGNKYEIFSEIKVPHNIPFFVRCDGRNFHRLTNEVKFKKPYDKEFAEIMVNSAKTIFKNNLTPILAYIFSDEINILFFDAPFNGRVEKIDSVVASLLSSAFSLELYLRRKTVKTISFDARVIPIPEKKILEYLAWRQLECWRNHINSYAFYTLIEKGFSREDAAKLLKGLKSAGLHDLVFREKGINLAKTPTWQRRGILLYFEEYLKEGVNKLTGEKVLTARRKLVENWELPIFNSPEGKNMLLKIIKDRGRRVEM